MKSFLPSFLAVVIVAAVAWLFFGKLVSPRAMVGSPVQAVRKASLHEGLVGKWGPPGKAGNIEFFDDGTFTSIADSERSAGRWNVIAADRVKLSASAFGIESISTLDAIVIDGDALTATLEGSSVQLIRAIAGPHSEKQEPESPSSAPSEVKLPPAELKAPDQAPLPAVEVKTSERGVWTDLDGREMQAKLLDVKRDETRKLVARFEKSDGKIYTFPVDQLVPEDKERALKMLDRD